MEIMLISGLEQENAKDFFKQISDKYTWYANDKSVHIWSDMINMGYDEAEKKNKKYIFCFYIKERKVKTFMMTEKEIQDVIDNSIVRFDILEFGQENVINSINETIL